MLLDNKEDYITNVKNFTSSFDENHFRSLASKDFNNWPKPLEEKWRLSRLGALSRIKMMPIEPDLKKISKIDKKTGSFFLKFVDGAFRTDLSSDLPSGVTLEELDDKESLNF